MNKKKVQEALSRIDNAVAQLNINRQGHIVLTNDLQLVQECCMNYFDHTIGKPKLPEEKHVGADEPTERPEPRDENSEGSGDSV